MIWMICAIAAALLTLLSAKAYFNKAHGSFRVVFVLLFLFAATYISYAPAFLRLYAPLPALWGNLIHTLQIITVDADLLEFYDIIRAGVSGGLRADLYTVLLGILHVTLPAASALTAVTVLLRCFSSLQLHLANRRGKPLFIFSELNQRSLQLTKSLKDLKCGIVFAGSREHSLPGEDGRRLNYIFKEERISDLDVKLRPGKQIYFFCLSQDENESLSCTLQLIDKYAASDGRLCSGIHIYQFSQYKDYSVFIDSAEKGSLDVRCVNEYEMLVYDLLNRYPLTEYANSGIHVLLHGSSELNIIALKAIAWCGQLSGFPMKISVVGMGIQRRVEELALSAPGLLSPRYHINFFDCSSERDVMNTIRRHCSDANYIIVSEETDNAAMDRGLMLRRAFYRLDPSFSNCPPIFCYIRDPAKFSIVRDLKTAESNAKRAVSYELVPFGSLSQVYTREKLVDSPLEGLSKNVHLAYEEIFSDGEIDVQAALRRYNIFEVNKRSNRANALHIRYKLNLLGLDYADEGDDREAVSLRDCLTGSALEQLSISEHDRWMAFLESEGWIPSTREEVRAYRESGVSRGRHNCPLLKMHPYICEYERLKDLSAELEGKDTTVYDQELILRIPDILGDKWNIMGKKYKIVKMKSN